MAKVNRTPARKDEGEPDWGELMRRAARRVRIPAGVPLRLKYQGDVDTLCIRFDAKLGPRRLEHDDEKGVIGIYDGEELIGLEILDITGGLKYANPT